MGNTVVEKVDPPVSPDTLSGAARILLNGPLWVVPVVLCAVLIVVAEYNILTFHTSAKLFIFMVSITMFAFAWVTFEFSRNSFLFILACGYLWIGSLDLLHTVVDEGMNLSIHQSVNKSTQLWTGTRFAEAVLLLLAPLFADKQLRRYVPLICFGVIAIALSVGIMSGGLPATYTDNIGLTDFQINSGYVTCGVLLFALGTLFHFGKGISGEEKVLITFSIVFVMLAELAFASTFSEYGYSNIIGHVATLFSYWFIFQAIVLLNLKQPYTNLLREREATKRHVEQIERQESRFEAIFNGIPEGIVFVDQDERIISANRSMNRLFGYAIDDLAGKNTAILLDNKEEAAALRERGHQSSGVLKDTLFETSYRRKDNSVFDGETLVSMIVGAKGEPLGVIRIIRDVTHRRHLEAQLLRSQKLEAVGRLAGGIAHDFNNILGIVKGNLEILQNLNAYDEVALSRVKTALRGANRGADLTTRLLGFSRREPRETDPVCANDLIRDMGGLLDQSLIVSIRLELNLARDLWPVRMDVGDFEDAILNLALNARDAMPRGGELIFETKNVVLHEDDVQQTQNAKPGDFVLITIRDTGSGMSSEILDKAIEPFFSTKDKGSGLGLSMVYGFAKRSSGHFDIDSYPGEGTRINIFLPRAHAVPARREEADTLVEPSGGSETILIVDDEENLASIAEWHLRQLGYRTITANCGVQARNILLGNEKIDLLFSDVEMPGGVNGHDLATWARSTNHDLRVLLTSGFTERLNESVVADGVTNAFLTKPYSQLELGHSVRSTLDAMNTAEQLNLRKDSEGNFDELTAADQLLRRPGYTIYGANSCRLHSLCQTKFGNEIPCHETFRANKLRT
jgi:PAS domain S-box-containing protein